MSIKKHIPNVITCGNLFCGCLAIVSAFKGDLVWSAYLVGVAAVFDFFDGFAARMLKVHSEIGKQLDSLADMVTFGVVPGIVMYKLIGAAAMNIIRNSFCEVEPAMLYFYGFSIYIAFLIPVFSALRLAKFNIDTRQTGSFIGVPTPANAILICALPLITTFQSSFFNGEAASIIGNIYFLIALTFVMCYLMIAELPLFALKFKNFGWPDNKIRYSFLVSALLLLILFHFIAIPFIIFLYIVLSMITKETPKQQQT